jgi:hypothetical protein
VTLSILSKLRLFYLCHLSKPSESRPVYRAIRRYHTRKIVELGIGDGHRALRMIEMAGRVSASSDIHYVGMDPFEGRSESDGKPISLKEIHQRLRATGVRVQLVPGNPPESLMRLANSLGKIDMLIVPAELDSSSYARIWFFVPRMLHERTQVFVESRLPDGQRTLRLKTHREIEELASHSCNRRAA